MKKLLMVVTLLISTLILAACNNNGLEFMEKANAINEWEAANTVVDMTMKLEMEEFGETIEMQIALQMDGYVDNEDVAGEMVMNMQIATTVGEDTEEINLENIKMYIDGVDTYISKNYLEVLFVGMELDIDELIEEDYILLEQDPAMDMFLSTLLENEDVINELALEVMKLIQVDIEVEKEDNQYTIVLDEQDIVDVLLSGIDNINEIALLVSDELELGLTQETVDLMVGMVLPTDEEALLELGQELVQMIDLEIEVQYIFEEDQVINNISFTLEPTEVLPISLEVIMDVTNTKADKREIEMPTSVSVLTEEDILEMVFGDLIIQPGIPAKVLSVDYNEKYIITDDNKVIDDITIIEEDGEIYLPLRAVYEGLGFEVNFDATTGYVTVSKELLGTIVHMSSWQPDIRSGVSYIGLSHLAMEGIEVYSEIEETGFIYFIH